MGFLSKIFGKSEPPFTLGLVTEMMDEDRYWRMIAESREASGGDLECQANALVAELENLTPAEMVMFRHRTDKLLHDSYNSHLWCAGYIMNGGLSDDGFEYFRLWLIGQGREIFERAKAAPDSLADLGTEDLMEQGYDFESLWYVALTAFENKTGGRSLYEYISPNFRYGEGHYPDMEFTWSETNAESMRALCPRLMEKHGEP
jgi:hypothetical protein